MAFQSLNQYPTEEPSELQNPRKKGGRPKLHNTKEDKLASRRIPVEHKKHQGRPRRFSTPQAKTESRRKTLQEYKPTGRPQKYSTDEDRVRTRRKQKVEYRNRKAVNHSVNNLTW